MEPPSHSPSLYPLVGLLVVAVLVYVFASLAYAAISSLNRGRVQRFVDENGLQAKRAMDFAEHSDVYLATAAVMRLCALLAAAVAVVQLFEQTALGAYSLLAWLILLGSTLVLGWIVPRSVAAAWPERVVLSVAIPFKALALIFAPLARLVAFATSALARVWGAEAIPEGPIVTPDELRVMVAASEEEGLIEQEERAMIDNVLEFEDISVREIMVPRPDIVALPVTSTVRDALDLFVQEGYSRLPLYRSSLDEITGVLYGKDLFPLVLQGRLDAPLGSLARPAYFVPESKRAADLLPELQLKRVHIAIVVDEYGGTAGLVTIEDLLEEIVGEIQDEYDVEEQKIVSEGNGAALVDGGVSIDDVNQALDLDLTTEEVDTVGGLVYEKLGRVPIVGDQVALDHAVLTVVGASGRRVTLVRVQRTVENLANGHAESGAA
ncbi:MAG TPA: hemolysin family protein [Chloroflexota bacterium]|nr:hemolysin family protein [Chloroflexota bacterium]